MLVALTSLPTNTITNSQINYSIHNHPQQTPKITQTINVWCGERASENIFIYHISISLLGFERENKYLKLGDGGAWRRRRRRRWRGRWVSGRWWWWWWWLMLDYLSVSLVSSLFFFFSFFNLELGYAVYLSLLGLGLG